MKKSLILVQLIATVTVYSFSTYAFADDHDHGHHRNKHHQYQSEERRYYQQRQDPRSHQGLAGGVVGSVLGYELGNGSPVVTGLGAAAGSFLGNGMAGGR